MTIYYTEVHFAGDFVSSEGHLRIVIFSRRLKREIAIYIWWVACYEVEMEPRCNSGPT